MGRIDCQLKRVGRIGFSGGERRETRERLLGGGGEMLSAALKV